MVDGLISVIVSTFEQPAHLERVLWGYARQRDREFELLVADDGSGPATQAVVALMAQLAGVPLRHVWQAHAGFRKNRILNQAIRTARGAYLIFTDGDCLPSPEFVATHRRLARPGRFLSGRYVKVSAAVTTRITPDDVRAGRATRFWWLARHGARPGLRLLRFAPAPGAAWLVDRLTKAACNFNGCNSSAWAADIARVNGFEERMGYGLEDVELGYRLVRSGVTGLQVRSRAPVLHLEHERPYGASSCRPGNLAIIEERRARALVGVEQHVD